MKRKRTLNISAILMTALLVFSGSAWVVAGIEKRQVGEERIGVFAQDISDIQGRRYFVV